MNFLRCSSLKSSQVISTRRSLRPLRNFSGSLLVGSKGERCLDLRICLLVSIWQRVRDTPWGFENTRRRSCAPFVGWQFIGSSPYWTVASPILRTSTCYSNTSVEEKIHLAHLWY